MKAILDITALALLVGALLLSGCATSEGQKAKAEHDALCAVLDTNQDGKISKEEFVAKATDKNKALEVYQKCDTGTKGYLTYDELTTRRWMIPPEIYMTPPPLVVPRR